MSCYVLLSYIILYRIIQKYIILYCIVLLILTLGSSKNSHRPKSFNKHRKPPDPPCINVAIHRVSMAGARIVVFFFVKAPPSAAFTQY